MSSKLQIDWTKLISLVSMLINYSNGRRRWWWKFLYKNWNSDWFFFSLLMMKISYELNVDDYNDDDAEIHSSWSFNSHTHTHTTTN